MDTIIGELQNANIIRESSSPFSSPILLVKKKNGQDRMCVDYRELNANTRSDCYPIPRIGDQIDRLHGSFYFSTIDMASGFHEIPVHKDSIERTAFVTPDGQYEYLAMPFGLKNAPSVFQRAINKALKGFEYVQVYIDDVLCPSVSISEGLERLDSVLKLLSRAGFSFNIKKCSFLKREPEYLGYVLRAGEIRPNPRKIQALEEAPTPGTGTQVRQFIGLASYFRQFILNFSNVIGPLYPLTQSKGTIQWTDKYEQIRRTIVKILTSEPVLAIFNPDLNTELHTDASSLGYGAVLIQRRGNAPHVIAFFSRRTSETESRYHSYELETLAVVRAVEHFRHYLYGRHFTVHTDCNALKASSTKRDLTPRVHRWWAILQSYDFNVVYREGRSMTHADYFSRNPVGLPAREETANSTRADISENRNTKDVRIVELQKGWLSVEQNRDNEILDIISKLKNKELPDEIAHTYDVRNGILYRKIERHKRSRWLPIVPRSLVWSLINHVHVDLRHLGFEKTVDKIYESYWFPNMSKTVRKFVNACLVCKACKGPSGAQQMQLHPIPKVAIPWNTIHVDITGKLSGKSQRKEYAFVIIDAFTKYVLLQHTLSLDSSNAIGALKFAVCLFGAPKRVIADQGRCFISSEFKSFCSENKMNLHLIATGASRANGQVERVMSTLKNLLTIIENSIHSVWREELGNVQLVLNTTRCRVTGFSPTELMFRIQAQSLKIAKVTPESDANNIRVNLDECRDEASENIKKEAGKEIERFNRNKASVKGFNVGDFVFVKCCERNQTKLDRKFRGPFKITKLLDGDRYELRHINGSNRCYKYAHESLREVPTGRAGLTDAITSMLDEDDDTEDDVSETMTSTAEHEASVNFD